MRYPLIPESERNELQQALARKIADGPRGEVRGPYVPLMHAPEIAAKALELGDLTRFHTSIPHALGEIAVCMAARAAECPYVWISHSRAAMKAGVDKALLVAIAKRERPASMTPDEALIVDFCREMLDNRKVSDPTFAAAEQRWGKKGVLEIASICGYYSFLACVLIAADHPVPPDAVPFGV